MIACRKKVEVDVLVTCIKQKQINTTKFNFKPITTKQFNWHCYLRHEHAYAMMSIIKQEMI